MKLISRNPGKCKVLWLCIPENLCIFHCKMRLPLPVDLLYKIIPFSVNTEQIHCIFIDIFIQSLDVPKLRELDPIRVFSHKSRMVFIIQCIRLPVRRTRMILVIKCMLSYILDHASSSAASCERAASPFTASSSNKDASSSLHPPYHLQASLPHPLLPPASFLHNTGRRPSLLLPSFHNSGIFLLL